MAYLFQDFMNGRNGEGVKGGKRDGGTEGWKNTPDF
jgi:hypothetical protein